MVTEHAPRQSLRRRVSTSTCCAALTASGLCKARPARFPRPTARASLVMNLSATLNRTGKVVAVAAQSSAVFCVPRLRRRIGRSGPSRLATANDAFQARLPGRLNVWTVRDRPDIGLPDLPSSVPPQCRPSRARAATLSRWGRAGALGAADAARRVRVRGPGDLCRVRLAR
jgi:hypothetical protein